MKKTVVILEDGGEFTFNEKEIGGKTYMGVKIKGNPIPVEVLKLTSPKEGEILEFTYDAQIGIATFKSSSQIISVTTE